MKQVPGTGNWSCSWSRRRTPHACYNESQRENGACAFHQGKTPRTLVYRRKTPQTYQRIYLLLFLHVWVLMPSQYIGYNSASLFQDRRTFSFSSAAMPIFLMTRLTRFSHLRRAAACDDPSYHLFMHDSVAIATCLSFFACFPWPYSVPGDGPMHGATWPLDRGRWLAELIASLVCVVRATARWR